MENKTITLPDADEMMRRLRSVMDARHTVEGLYPKITNHAGESKTIAGVEILVRLAIYDYTAGLPDIVAINLEVMVPAFTVALTK